MLVYLLCRGLSYNYLSQIRYELEVFKIRWLRWGAYWNRFNWAVIEPIKAWLFLHGHIDEKPLILVVKEFQEELAGQQGKANK
jgi:hypothetical protein